jgi:2-C-methyl-D-erythritol 4-phosphate cytidylyltransferase
VSTALVIPAAGIGRRLGLGKPKAIIDLAGIPMVRRTLSRFERVAEIVAAVVVAPPGFVTDVSDALLGVRWEGCEVRVVAGGSTRQESVRCGLASLGPDVDLVCVHDAARPLVTHTTISAVIDAARHCGAASAASRPNDSVREDVEGGGTRPLDRSRLWLVETPQAFVVEMLRNAHERARAVGYTASDDATLVEAFGGTSVRIVESDGWNPKITRPADLRIVRQMLDA